MNAIAEAHEGIEEILQLVIHHSSFIIHN